ncbi:MAG: hypothetical protein HYX27_11900 [Acidobacteria bacterium]|nr:hypothetical protein [Acidobacteriota bacterium]
MQLKHTRAEQSRINGAKSRGPKTPHGKQRAAAASLQHGLYASTPSLRPTIGEPQYQALREHYQSVWTPANPYIADKIDDLVAYRWELNRLREVRRQFLAHVFNETAVTCSEKDGLSVVCETEIRANAASGTLDRFDLRIRRCNLEISRIERDILRLHCHFSTSGASQNPLETKDREPENPIAWAEETFDLALDVHQAGILTTQAPKTACNAARYSGKTTALALRALYESVHNPDKQIACLSPNGALLNKVKELAAIAGYQPDNVTGQPTEDTKLILIDDAAEITNHPDFHQAQLLIASTPKGADNYFHAQWQSADTVKIFAPARSCDTIGEDLLRHAEVLLSKEAFQQEFLCEFHEKPQPRCRLLPLTQ